MPAGLVHRGATLLESVALDVPVYVVRHPTAGLIVFDTGLPPAGRDESPVDQLFERVPGQDIAAQMRVVGLPPQQVSTVVLSHLHIDHTGSIPSFPQAQLVVARAELESARAVWLWEAPFYRPSDYEGHREVREIDYSDAQAVATFTRSLDLFGDGSVLLIDLMGHTAGSQGLLVRSSSGPVLLTGDAAYTQSSWRYGSMPLLAFDLDAWWLVSWKIKKFSQLEPALLVLPGHDLKPARDAPAGRIAVHEFEAAAAVSD